MITSVAKGMLTPRAAFVLLESPELDGEAVGINAWLVVFAAASGVDIVTMGNMDTEAFAIWSKGL